MSWLAPGVSSGPARGARDEFAVEFYPRGCAGGKPSVSGGDPPGFAGAAPRV